MQCLDNLFMLVATKGFHSDDIHQLTICVVGRHQNLIDAWQAVTAAFDNDAQVECSSESNGR